MRKINRYSSCIEKSILEDFKDFSGDNAVILLSKINNLIVKYDSSIIRGILSYCNIIIDNERLNIGYNGEITVRGKGIGTQTFTSTHVSLKNHLNKAKVLNFNAGGLINHLMHRRLIVQ